MEAQHGGSSRIPFILQLLFKISLKVMICQAILKDKHGAQHMFCFEEFKPSSCISKCNSFISHHLRWCYAIRDNLSSCFMIQQFSRMRYLNPSLSSLELSWVIFHLKLSLRIVAIYGAYKWPKFFFYPPSDIASHLLVLINPILFPVSGRLSPHNLICTP